MSAAGVACLVAAGALHLPVLALGVFVCAGLDLLGTVALPVEPARPQPAELVEAPISRAA
jgi:hypothetical protein